jgi:hypothetical protein
LESIDLEEVGFEDGYMMIEIKYQGKIRERVKT